MEGFIFYVLSVWAIFYMVNHAAMFDKARAVILPKLPRWLAYSVTCAFCAAFWITAIMSLFVGASFYLTAAPVCCLFVNLAYERMKGGE